MVLLADYKTSRIIHHNQSLLHILLSLNKIVSFSKSTKKLSSVSVSKSVQFVKLEDIVIF